MWWHHWFQRHVSFMKAAVGSIVHTKQKPKNQQRKKWLTWQKKFTFTSTFAWREWALRYWLLHTMFTSIFPLKSSFVLEWKQNRKRFFSLIFVAATVALMQILISIFYELNGSDDVFVYLWVMYLVTVRITEAFGSAQMSLFKYHCILMYKEMLFRCYPTVD